MEETTTSRVRSSTRDRVRALGRETRQTADAVVTRALELHEREAFCWQAWERAQQERTPQEQAQDEAEVAVWDRASSLDHEQRERRADTGAHL